MTSSSSTEPSRFKIGELGRPHGLDGYLGLYLAEEDSIHVRPGLTLFLDDDPMVVRGFRQVHKGFQVAFEGMNDRVAAESVRGREVFAPTRRVLEENEFWPADLIGLGVVSASGDRLGVVSDVVVAAAQDRLVVSSEGGRFEVPFVADLVPEVNLEVGVIVIADLPGLMSP